MTKMSLIAAARGELEAARQANSGRSATTVYGGHERALRQTLIALRAGQRLEEHESPGEATLQVLGGRIRLIAGDVEWQAMAGDLLVIPDARHRVEAEEDSTFLLTVVKPR